MKQTIRVRFAPSPTGFLHIGGVRTALFNYLFARKEKGAFLLRIEDTDRERSKPEFETEILESLKWLGLDWDENILKQSERLQVYQKACEHLVKEGFAYPIEEKGRNAIKFKVSKETTRFHDLIHGPIEFDGTSLDDFVIQKSDGFPTYHFACVVDDHEMGITHVIRGDDHISNTPKQLLIYEAFGWKAPEFAHLPLIFGQDRTPLSKRHGTVSITAYQKEGYLPEGILNYLALLGWSPGGDQEIFGREDLTQFFSLERVNKTNACFDPEKLKWMNAEHLRQLGNEDYIEKLRKFLAVAPLTPPSSPSQIWPRGQIWEGKAAGGEPRSPRSTGGADQGRGEEEHKRFPEIALLYKNRIQTFQEFSDQAAFFFTDKVNFNPEAVRKYLKEENTRHHLEEWYKTLAREGIFSDPQALETSLRSTAQRLGIDARALIHPTRVAISGRSVTPGLFEIMVLLGKEVVLDRLQYVIINFNAILSEAKNL